MQRASFYAWRRRLADGDGDDGYGDGGGDVAGCGGQAGMMAGGFIEARIVEASATGPHLANTGELPVACPPIPDPVPMRVPTGRGTALETPENEANKTFGRIDHQQVA